MEILFHRGKKRAKVEAICSIFGIADNPALISVPAGSIWHVNQRAIQNPRGEGARSLKFSRMQVVWAIPHWFLSLDVSFGT
jgi:hypothetical protein